MQDLLNKLFEAPVSALKRKQKSITKLFPSFHDRVNKVGDMGGVQLDRQDQDTWKFKIHSGTKSDVWYDNVLHFKNVIPTLQTLIQDKRLWVSDKSGVNLRKLADQFFKKIDVQTMCSCRAAQFWGPNYTLSKSKYDAKYGDKENRPPKIRNPKEYGIVCKHGQALLKVLPFYKGTLAKWFKDFYFDEIAKIEADVQEKYGWVSKAAEELGKRKKAAKEKPKKRPSRKPNAEPEEVQEPEQVEPGVEEPVEEE